MTPSLFDLPVRPPEVAKLAVLLFEQTGDKLLTDELRRRIAGRSALLQLEGLAPKFGSLERDPVHPSAFFIAVDGVHSQPLLLRIAPGTSPSSGIFPKSILIGRMPGPKGVEIVANAIPFAHTNTEAIETFVRQVNPAFGVKPAGIRSAIIVRSKSPETVLPIAFEAFRELLQVRAVNLAGAENVTVAAWAAIRTGWREGYVSDASNAILCSKLKERQRAISVLEIEEVSRTSQQIEQCSQYLL